MDQSSIKKALLMQLMKVLSEEEMKPFKKGDVSVEIEAEAEPEMEDEDEMDCEPGSKEDRLKKLKKLSAEA